MFSLKKFLQSQLQRNNFEKGLKIKLFEKQLLEYFQLLYDHPNKDPFQLTKDFFGFKLFKANSKVKNAGFGVFINGKVSQGSIVAIYPGTVYERSDPIFIQSFRNKFILKRKDLSLIDGNDRGISRYMYKSTVYKYGLTQNDEYFADLTWLDFYKNDLSKIKNPLGIGHYINSTKNGIDENEANVMYFEFDFINWPSHLMKFIPNVHYQSYHEENVPITKSILLISLKDIENGSELYASYFNLVTK